MEKELETTDATNYHLYGEGAWSKLLQVADGVSDSTAIVYMLMRMDTLPQGMVNMNLDVDLSLLIILLQLPM